MCGEFTARPDSMSAARVSDSSAMVTTLRLTRAHRFVLCRCDHALQFNPLVLANLADFRRLLLCRKR